MALNLKYNGKDVVFSKKNTEYSGLHLGLCYQFLDKDLITVQPEGSVCCKDFLQDFIYCEKLGKESVEIYQYRYDKCGFLEDPQYEKLIIGLDYRLGIDNLQTYVNNLQNFLNILEEKLKFNPSTIVLDDSKTYVIVFADKEWCNRPVLLSLYALLLRCGILYTGGDLISYLANLPRIRNVISNDDVFIFKQKDEILLSFIKDLTDENYKKLLTWEEFYKNISSMSSEGFKTREVHYSGVMSYLTKNFC